MKIEIVPTKKGQELGSITTQEKLKANKHKVLFVNRGLLTSRMTGFYRLRIFT